MLAGTAAESGRKFKTAARTSAVFAPCLPGMVWGAQGTTVDSLSGVGQGSSSSSGEGVGPAAHENGR